MSHTLLENRNLEATPRCSTLVTWLRKCLEERRTATILASAAIATMVTTALLPARMELSAAQVLPDSYATSSTTGLQESNAGMPSAGMTNAGNSNTDLPGSYQAAAANTSDDSGIVISPRGKDSAVQSIPFRPMVAPPVRRSPASASLAPANSAKAGQRGVLQAPVFGASGRGVPVNGAASTSAAGDTSGSHSSTMPALRAGHSGLAGGASNSRQGQGYNYVGASDVASLPHSGSSQRGSVSAAVPGTSGSTPGRPTRLAGMQDAANIQNGDPTALTIPNASDVDSKPSTPVPTVPSVNGSEAHVELPPGSKTAPVQSSTNGASVSTPATPGSGRGI